MPIGNLGDKVSNTAREAVDKSKNKPEYEDGFDNTVSSDSFDSIFSDIDNTGTGDSGSGSDSMLGNASTTGWDVAGGTDGQCGMNTDFGAFGNANNGFGTFGQQQPPQEIKPGFSDIVGEAAQAGFISTWKVFIVVLKSIKERNYDDLADFGSNLVKLGLAIAGVGAVLGIIMSILGVSALGITGNGLSIIISGLVVTLVGMTNMTVVYAKYSKNGGDMAFDVSNVNDVQQADEGFNSESDAYSSLFGDEEEGDSSGSALDDMFSSDEYESTETVTYGDDFSNDQEAEEEEAETVDLEELVEKAPDDAKILTRKFLFETFKPFFVRITPGFSKDEELYAGSTEYDNCEVLCRQAFASAFKVPLDEMEITIESIHSTHFCYVMRIQRIVGKSTVKLETIASEMEAYFRDNADDFSVACAVVIERDCYKITLTKGAKPTVTFGDCFGLEECCDFFLSEKNKLPMFVGVDDYGKVVMVDGKKYTTILIAGKQRSGKSWFIDGLLMSLMTFNSPEDVQFIIIDPKESNLFKTIATMPHVCGLHTEHKLFEIVNDLIDKEGKARKKMLSDNRCDDVWALRKKGVNVPIIYLIIDEYMSVLNSYSQPGFSALGTDKQLQAKINVLITQLPSLGIFLMFVPHRAQGVVDKTTRELMTFSAAVRATNEVVKETLGIAKWDRPLVDPGDAAINIDGRAKFVRGTAMVEGGDEGDANLMLLIESIAKTFYKMGVDIPDMRSVGTGYNRNQDKINEMLRIGDSTSQHVHYTASNVFDDMSDADSYESSEDEVNSEFDEFTD